MKSHRLALAILTLLMNSSFILILSGEKTPLPPTFSPFNFSKAVKQQDFSIGPNTPGGAFPQDFSFLEKPYNLAEELNLNFQLSLRANKTNSNFFNSVWNPHLSPISLSKNWYLPIQNWDSIARFYEMEIAQAEESQNSLLLGFFQKVEKRSKIGLGFHYTDLSDDVTDLELNSSGLFINYIVEY
ncbi:MAG: hypothetical protein ACI9S8_001393 [Chlamydiales bacterium]|jgi:hypothetical protein